MSEFPVSCKALIATLVELFKIQKQHGIASILEAGEAEFVAIGHDGWNGGTDIYALNLDLPVPTFASIETQIANYEKSLLGKIHQIVRPGDGYSLSSVSIRPSIEQRIERTALPVSSDRDITRIWGNEKFLRLFISHSSKHKQSISALKSRLFTYGISAFVAHEDIEPTEEWLIEIERALNSADAVLAVMTSDFHESKWTDQEIGIGIGRGLLVIPVCVGLNPYGFIGKKQAIMKNELADKALASSIVATLLKNPKYELKMKESLVEAFINSKAYLDSIMLSRLIVTLEGFSRVQLEKILEATRSNRQIAEAHDVAKRIEDFFEKNISLKVETDPF